MTTMRIDPETGRSIQLPREDTPPQQRPATSGPASAPFARIIIDEPKAGYLRQLPPEPGLAIVLRRWQCPRGHEWEAAQPFGLLLEVQHRGGLVAVPTPALCPHCLVWLLTEACGGVEAVDVVDAPASQPAPYVVPVQAAPTARIESLEMETPTDGGWQARSSDAIGATYVTEDDSPIEAAFAPKAGRGRTARQ